MSASVLRAGGGDHGGSEILSCTNVEESHKEQEADGPKE